MIPPTSMATITFQGYGSYFLRAPHADRYATIDGHMALRLSPVVSTYSQAPKINCAKCKEKIGLWGVQKVTHQVDWCFSRSGNIDMRFEMELGRRVGPLLM